MSNITIQKSPTGERPPRAAELFNKIQQRAYDRFVASGFVNGHDLDHWLEAERELVWKPPADVSDTGPEFTVRMETPGFRAGDLHVSILPDRAVVEGERKLRNEPERTLYLEVALPAPVDPARAAAVLQKGELTVTIPKAEAAKPKIAVVAAA